MAYLDQTTLNDLQDDSRVQLEMRRTKHGLIDFAKWLNNGADWLTSGMRSKLQSIVNQSFELPALIEDTITTSTIESFDIPVNASESTTVTATKITIFSGYSMKPYQNQSNLISKEEYKRNKRLEIFKAMAKSKELSIQAFLETQKTQVLDVTGAPGAASANYVFNAGTDSLEIKIAAQGDIMFSTLDTIMSQNDLNNMNAIVGTYGLEHVMNEYTKYGQSNDKNLQSQLIPDLFLSRQVTNTDRFTGYLGQSGAMAMVENYLPEFLAGESVDNAVWGLTDQAVPFLNERIMMYQNRGKASATTPGTVTPENIMSVFEEEAFVSKFFFIQKFNSDRTTRVGDIVRIEGLTT